MQSPKPAKRWLACLLAVLLMLSLVPPNAEAASSGEIKKQINALKSEKKELQAQIDEIRSQYEANENELLDMVSRKDTIDQEMALLSQQIININDQVASYALLIADQQDALDEAEELLAELKVKNKERIRAMEEEGKLTYWEVIFRANSFSDLLDRIDMVQEIAASDQRRIREMSEAADRVLEIRTSLETEKAELEQTREELSQTQETLEEKRLEADELLRQLIETGEEFEALLEQSEDEQEKLMQEIAAKEKEYKQAQYEEWLATYVPPTTRPGDSTKPSTQAPSSGGWISPLTSYRLTSPFGMRVHPILGYERMHNGVDMAAPQGTPIYAAKAGKVTIAKWSDSAGYYVSINHGDGFSSIYMHMTHYIVSAGQYVSRGQVIGYVGNTGLSKGAHLHFGISYNGTYVNPMAYI